MKEGIFIGTGRAIWFFGLSGSGKTTLSKELAKTYRRLNLKTIVLDGDVLRNGINKNLGFNREDRCENVRRVAEICKLMLKVGIVPIVAAITPYESDRRLIRDIIGSENLVFVHVRCPIEICEKRDPKGLYLLARNGRIKKFTGISDPFESTELEVMTIDTGRLTLEQSLIKLFNKKQDHEI